jgi:secondary thiamine-phosphate synthase enzyme
MVHGEQLTIHTQGNSDVHDITSQVGDIVAKSHISEGIVCVSVIGSTASITTIEFEPALSADLTDELDRLIPSSRPTRHGNTWGDDNGFSHLRASLMGPGITVPVSRGKPVLGTWQQIVVVDHDNRPRSRTVFVQIVGE